MSFSVFKASFSNLIAKSKPFSPKSAPKALGLFDFPLYSFTGSMQMKLAGYPFDLLESTTTKRYVQLEFDSLKSFLKICSLQSKNSYTQRGLRYRETAVNIIMLFILLLVCG